MHKNKLKILLKSILLIATIIIVFVYNLNNKLIQVVDAASVCGNNIVEEDEQCDDGNIEDGDGCSASCQFEWNNINIGFNVQTLRQVPDLNKAIDGTDFEKDFLRVLAQIKNDGFTTFRSMFPYPGSRQTMNQEEWENQYILPGLKTLANGDNTNLIFSLSSYPREFLPNLNIFESPNIIETTRVDGNIDVIGSENALNFVGIRDKKWNKYIRIKINNVPNNILGAEFNQNNQYWTWTVIQNQDNSYTISSCDTNDNNCNYDNILNELENLTFFVEKRIQEIIDPTEIETLKKFQNRLIFINHYPFSRISQQYWNKFAPYTSYTGSVDGFEIEDERSLVYYQNYIKNVLGTNNNTGELSSDYNQSLFYKLVNNVDFGEKAKNWLYEIGNEPDAQGYFWGTSTDFINLFTETMKSARILQKTNPNVLFGGPALTSRFGETQNKRKINFIDFTHKLINNEIDNDFISYHIYQNIVFDKLKNGEDNFDDTTLDHPWGKYMDEMNWINTGTKRKLITEWNVATSASKNMPLYLDNDQRTNSNFINTNALAILGENCNKNKARDQSTTCILHSKSFMNYLIIQMAFNYKNKVDDFILFKLMDDVLNGNENGLKPQLGLFNKDGEDKMAYRQVFKVNNLIKDGYIVFENENLIVLFGKNKVNALVLAKNDIYINSQKYIYKDGSVEEVADLKLKANRWMEIELIDPSVSISIDDFSLNNNFSICGNAIIEEGEQCDDGNTSSGDGCSSACQNEIVTCDINHPNLCVTDVTCDTAGGFLCNNKCQDDSCDINENMLEKINGDVKIKISNTKYNLDDNKTNYVKKRKIKLKGEEKELKNGKVELYIESKLKKTTEIDSTGDWSIKYKGKKNKTQKYELKFYNKDDEYIDNEKFKIRIDEEDPEIKIPSFLNKKPGDIIWWNNTDNHKLKKTEIRWDGKKYKFKIKNTHKNETRRQEWKIPADATKGLYNIRITTYDKSGNKEMKYIVVRVW